MNRKLSAIVLLLTAALAVAGCGSSSSKSPGASKQSEQQSAATGDIPDNQVFLVFRNTAGGYAVKYPEGWTQRGGGGAVTFQDKNNLIHVVSAGGGTPTPRQVEAALLRERSRVRSLHTGPARGVVIPGVGAAIKITYTTVSAPNPVTGKRVKLGVDRYVLAHRGRQVTVDLGTPRGVDNVDAYRLIIRSFRWL
jgi:hypothetical protein